MNIGERIKKRREELGMTQLELAKKVGYTSKSTITKIEKDANQLRQTKIMKFAEALETTPGYLIGYEEEPAQEKTLEITYDEMIAAYLMLLNEDGFKEALKRLEELTELDKYRKNK